MGMGLGSSRRTVLVTGAAGFLGSHLVDRLLSTDRYDVIGLDNLMTGSMRNLSKAIGNQNFHFQIGDVREPIGVYAELVFNMACPASPIHYQSDPWATFSSSVLGAQRLIEMARGRKCTIVQSSTSEVYGDPTVSPQPESYWGNVNPVGPRSCYDEGKRGAETLLSDARRAGIDTRIVRIFNTYGPRMSFDDGRVVSTFIVQILTGKPVTVFGDGSQTRSFCYVDDTIDGLMKVAQLDTLDGPVNIGNPNEVTVVQLAKMIHEACGGFTLQINNLPGQVDDPKRRCPDISKANTLFGFDPKVSLGSGISRTVDDFKRRLFGFVG